MASEEEWNALHRPSTPGQLGRELLRVPVAADLTGVATDGCLPADAVQLIRQSAVALEAGTLHGMCELEEAFAPLDRLIYLFPESAASAAPPASPGETQRSKGGGLGSTVRQRLLQRAPPLPPPPHNAAYRRYIEGGEPGSDGVPVPVCLPQTASPAHTEQRRLVPFSLRNRQWSDVPKTIRIARLHTLVLAGNGLTDSSLPLALRRLRHLVRLDLSNNKLKTVPDDLFLDGGARECLQWLSLSANLLREVPRALLDLPVLRHLDLSRNRLHALPRWLPRSAADSRPGSASNSEANVLILDGSGREPRAEVLFIDASRRESRSSNHGSVLADRSVSAGPVSAAASTSGRKSPGRSPAASPTLRARFPDPPHTAQPRAAEVLRTAARPRTVDTLRVEAGRGAEAAARPAGGYAGGYVGGEGDAADYADGGYDSVDSYENGYERDSAEEEGSDDVGHGLDGNSPPVTAVTVDDGYAPESDGGGNGVAGLGGLSSSFPGLSASPPGLSPPPPGLSASFPGPLPSVSRLSSIGGGGGLAALRRASSAARRRSVSIASAASASVSVSAASVSSVRLVSQLLDAELGETARQLWQSAQRAATEQRPGGMPRLPELRTLLLAGNRLRLFPPELCGAMRELRRLDVSRNKLARLPSTLGYCSQLEELNVSANVLREIDASVLCLRLPRLHKLSLAASIDADTVLAKLRSIGLRTPARRSTQGPSSPPHTAPANEKGAGEGEGRGVQSGGNWGGRECGGGEDGIDFLYADEALRREASFLLRAAAAAAAKTEAAAFPTLSAFPALPAFSAPVSAAAAAGSRMVGGHAEAGGAAEGKEGAGVGWAGVRWEVGIECSEPPLVLPLSAPLSAPLSNLPSEAGSEGAAGRGDSLLAGSLREGVPAKLLLAALRTLSRSAQEGALAQLVHLILFLLLLYYLWGSK
ncbi:hypothetical protein T492DRAFT_259148 [Pavlovales sp. CCMP2436]|nr:hypothetical protein T492DRAFT_259148 [Pavlovales sp. CCMP2436]